MKWFVHLFSFRVDVFVVVVDQNKCQTPGLHWINFLLKFMMTPGCPVVLFIIFSVCAFCCIVSCCEHFVQCYSSHTLPYSHSFATKFPTIEFLHFFCSLVCLFVCSLARWYIFVWSLNLLILFNVREKLKEQRAEWKEN